MLLRSTPERQDAELRYVRDMHLNAVRFEGKLEDDHFLELCDRYGILVLAGWCCCDHWEQWQGWDKEDETIAAESLRDQLRRLQRHPSLADWMYGSDNPPPPKIEEMYVRVIKEVEWPNPFHSSATAKKTPQGETGVKMTGPYEYVAPSYWTLDTTRGGAHGFNTETSPGPAPPPMESLRQMLPQEHLWPIDSWWDYHAGGGAFKDIHVFTEALNARYGTAASRRIFEEGADDGVRGASRDVRGVWPQQVHVDRRDPVDAQQRVAGADLAFVRLVSEAGRSYFGAKKANEPLHVQYSYDDRSVAVVNSFYRAYPAMQVTAKVYNLDMTEKFSRTATLDVGPDSSTRVFVLPEIAGLSGTYFVSLTLGDVSRNFYWLSTKPEILDWNKSNWYYTPTKTFADYSSLNTLPIVELQATVRNAPGSTTVTVTNPGKAVAFGVHLKVTRASDGEEILPVLWEDNYFALLPGETRTVTASYQGKEAGAVEVEGWNVVQQAKR